MGIFFWKKKKVKILNIDTELLEEPKDTPLPETMYEKYLELRVQYLEKAQASLRNEIINILDDYGLPRSGGYRKYRGY